MTRWPVVLVFGALPTVGLVAGPAYAVLIFGLAVVQLINRAVIERRTPIVTIDPGLCLLAAAFATLCWASASWSIDPAHSLHAALQMTAILLGAMALLAGPPLDHETTERLFSTLLIATIVGAAILAADCLLGYRFQSLVAGHPHPGVVTKYNRGIDYLVLIAWPQFAYIAWRRRWRDAVLLAVCMVVIVAIGAGLAARVAAAVGILVLALAVWLPRAVAPILAAGTVVLAASLPFTMRVMADHRMALAPHLKLSGLQRLEIWDFMTARVFERPLLGWGIAVSNAVPITPAEISTYVYQGSQGTYPHDQWLELWVETGAIGAAIGLAFALLVIVRIQRMAPPIRPFAFAAFASAITVSCVNFEVVTDSWWAALAATAYLLTMLHHCVDRADTA
jgi:exopolysaccharide production protein ExoQ